MRERGQSVVQCHGCFDIVHPGHVRYLQFARRLGDVLVVSLTGDAMIDKGPDRPYIPQSLRAENLAALEFVDWVVIDPNPTACEMLERVRPDVYVKGREYAASADPRFVREREIVESYGGRVIFHSGDVIFSSTRLIRSLDREAHLAECRVRAMCAANGITLADVRRTVGAFEHLRVLVVGDVVHEEYVLCDAREGAGRAPVVSLEQVGAESFWGGAAALASQFAALGSHTSLISTIGRDKRSSQLPEDLDRRGVKHELFAVREDIERHRTFLADDTKLFNVSSGASDPLDSACEQRIRAAIRRRMPDADLLVWSDHGGATITPHLVRQVAQAARDRHIPIAAASEGARGELAMLCDTDLLCVTERRLRSCASDLGSGLPAVAWRWLEQTGGRTAIVSLHKNGLIGFDGRGDDQHTGATPQRLRSEFVPSLAQHYIDVLGADEAIQAAAGLAFAANASVPMATYLAAAAQAMVVGRAGRTPCQLHELAGWVDSRPELRPESGFLPDAATPGDIARIAPPLPAIEPFLVAADSEDTEH